MSSRNQQRKPKKSAKSRGPSDIVLDSKDLPITPVGAATTSMVTRYRKPNDELISISEILPEYDPTWTPGPYDPPHQINEDVPELAVREAIVTGTSGYDSDELADLLDYFNLK